MMQHPKRRKYSLSRLSYSPHQNGPSHTRTYNSPVHHSGSPRRFHTPENNRGCPRSYNSPDVQNGDNAISPSAFYHHSPKYQRTNINEKHPPNRQNNEPYWVDKLKHEPSDTSPYSPQTTNSSEQCPYSPRQTKEPYWADTVGRKANNTSPKLIHVSEKRPTRQTKEPYWMESFEHYELSSHHGDLMEENDGFAQPPMVHRELPTPAPQYDRSLSYRFPNQDPQYLKRCISSLKRKHQETATTTTHDVKISKSESSESESTSTKKTECSKEANTQGSSKSCRKSEDNSEDSSQSNSIVATYDGNGNFIVVSKASSTVTTCVMKNNQTSSSSVLNRFENDPEEGDVELVSIDVQEKVETTGKDKIEEQQSSLIPVGINHGSIDQSSQESTNYSVISNAEVEKSKTNIEVIKVDSDDVESLKTCAKVDNDDAESLSEAESEVFDDIFLKLENDAHWSEEPTQAKESGQKDGDLGADFDYNDDEPSRSEGSISPTFDSTLLRYLDDNIRNRIENRELSSHASAKEVGDGDKDQAVWDEGAKRVDDSAESDSTIIFPEEEHERSVLSKTCDELASDGDTKETRNERDKPGKSFESASSQLCIGGGVEKSDCAIPVAITKVPDSEGPQQRVDGIKENKKDSCTPVATKIPQSLDDVQENKNDCVTPVAIPKISDEKEAETLLQFDQDSSLSTVQECATVQECPLFKNVLTLSYRQKLSQNSEMKDKTLVSTDNHTVNVEGIDKSLDEIPISNRKASHETTNGSGIKDKTLRETDNLSTNVEGAEASLDQRSLSNRMTDSHETIANSEISRERSQDSENNMPEVAPTVETSTENDMNVDEAIKFIRETCQDKVKKSVKRFESMINKPTEAEQEMTANEAGKTSESKEGNKEPQQMMTEEDNSSFDMSNSSIEHNSSIEDNNSAFVPLCEGLLLSVKKELHKKEEKSKTGNAKSQTHEGDNSCGTKDTFSDEKNRASIDISEDVAVSSDSPKVVSSDTTESQESSTYNMLHSAVLASKMANINTPSQSSNDNEGVSLKDPGKSKTPTSDIQVSKALDSKTLSEKPKPFEEPESASMSKTIELVEGNITDPEIYKDSMTKVSNNLDSTIPREEAKTSKEPDSEVEVCNIDTKTIQISNATEAVDDISINDPDMSKDSMAEMSKALGLEKEIPLSKTAIEPQSKGENCNTDDIEMVAQDITTVLIEDIAKKDPDICKTHGLEIHKASIEVESKVSSNNEEMEMHTSKKNGDSDVQNFDRKDTEIESSNTKDIMNSQKSKVIQDNRLNDPDISKSSEAVVKVSESLDIEGQEYNESQESEGDETLAVLIKEEDLGDTGSKSDIEIPSQISETTDVGAKHLTKDLQMSENPEISEKAETIISQKRTKSSSNDSLTAKLEAKTSDVEERLIPECEIESRGLPTPNVQATRGMGPNSISTEDTKGMEIDDSNLRILCNTASALIDDETPQVTENQEEADAKESSNSRVVNSRVVNSRVVNSRVVNSRVVNSPASTVTEDETPQATQNQEKAVVEDHLNSRVVKSPATTTIQGETPQASEEEKKADVAGKESSKSDSSAPVAVKVHLKSDADDDKAYVEHKNNSKSDSSAPVVVESKDPNSDADDGKTSLIEGKTPQVSKEQKKADVEHKNNSKSDSSDIVAAESKVHKDTSKSDSAVAVKSNDDNDDTVAVKSNDDTVAVKINDDTVPVKSNDDYKFDYKSDVNVRANSDADDAKVSLIMPQVSKERKKADVEHKNNSKSDTVADTSKSNPAVAVKSNNDNDNTVAVKSNDDNDDTVKSNDDYKSDGDDHALIKGTSGEAIVVAEQQETSSELKILEQQKNNDCTMEEDVIVPVENKLEENLTSPNESKLENDRFIPNESNDDDLLVSNESKLENDRFVPNESNNDDLLVSNESKLENDRFVPNESNNDDLLVSNESKLDNEQEDTEMTTAAFSKLLESNQDRSFKHLLIDILTKNLEITAKDEEIESKYSFQDSAFMQSPSPDSVMTDSENSSASFEDIYVQNLLTRADRLSDMDMSSHESSDIEMGVPSGLSETQEGSSTHDTELTNDRVLKKAGQKSDPEMDSTRNENSDIEMTVLSHPPETQETDLSQNNELAKDLVSKKAGEKSDTEMDNTSNESSVIETCTKSVLSGAHELTKDLVSTHEGEISVSKESKQGHKVETLVCNSSIQERQSTRTSVDPPRVSRRISNKERKEVSKNIKEVLRNSKEFSKNTTELSKSKTELSENYESKNDKELSENDTDVSKNNKEVSKNGTDLSKSSKELSKISKERSQNSKELSKNNNEASINNQELSINNKDVSKDTKGKITPRKRGRPSKRSYLIQNFDSQKDVSAKKPKRRSPRRRKPIHDENDGLICPSILCSRAIPYRRNKLKTFHLGLSKDSIKLEKDLRKKDRESFELSADQVIDIMEVCDDVDDFHLKLDDASEEESSLDGCSPEQLYNLLASPSSEKTLPQNSLGSSLPLETTNSPASSTKPNEEAAIINIPTTNSGTRDKTILKERSPLGSLPQGIDNSVAGTTIIPNQSSNTSGQSKPGNSSQGRTLPNHLGNSLTSITIPRKICTTPNKSIAKPSSLKSSLADQICNSPSSSTIPSTIPLGSSIPVETNSLLATTPRETTHVKSIAEKSSLIKDCLGILKCRPPASSIPLGNNSQTTTPRRSTRPKSLPKENPASNSMPLHVCSLGASNNVCRNFDSSNENTSSKSLAEESPLSNSREDRSSTRSEVCISLGTPKPDEGRLAGSMSSDMTRDKTLPEKVRLDSSEVLSASISNELHTSLGSSKPSERSQSLDGFDENLVPTSALADVCSSTGSSLPTSPLSQNMEDISSQSSTGYSSTSTAMMDSQESSTESNGRHDIGESLKITLISETDPDTGKTNWTQSPGKLTEIVEKEASTGYGLRPSKTRKTKNPSPTPTEPNAKKRRITITDLRTGTQSPQALHDLAKRPLEEYIRSVEKVYRSSDKNPKKGSLSIAMNDHVSKTTSQDQEGDYLKLGDTEVMYEIVKKAYDESKLKHCRPSPRSLYFAAKQGNALQVLVLAAGCNMNATIPQEKHKTAMHAAAGAGHADVLRLLCMIGGNLSCLDTNLQTPLFDAVENQRTEVVKFLISQDVNLNLKDSQGMTVLHVAAQKSNLEIINLLMDTRKLGVNEQDNGGWTALMWTAEGMRMDVARCLLKWGANINILDSEQNTCLHWASLAGGTEIMDLLLKSNVHIDARNMFGATALHISAREGKLPNIKTLANYRPNMEIRNAEGKKAIELAPLHSKCYRQLKSMELLMSLAKCTLKEHLISRDISRGQEKRPIPCINEVDDENLPDDFVYVSNNLESKSEGFDRSMTGCNCSDGCVNDKHCECAQLSARKRFWYDETGRINSEIFEEDRPLVYECNMKCKCWSNCHQRVVQRGITAGLQLYKTQDKGWAVRTQALIPKGTFVCEYVGEILTDSEADRREDDCYLFDLDVKGQSTLFCLDAKFYGNITRFINHSCDPNILPVRVFTDHQVKSCPRIAFFAARDIKPYEEVCSNYGEKFWTVKKSEFRCVCNTSKCKYGAYKK